MTDQHITDFLPQDTALVHKDLVRVVLAMRDYIDAIPDDAAAAFPVMPGFDRDWADEVVEKSQELSKK